MNIFSIKGRLSRAQYFVVCNLSLLTLVTLLSTVDILRKLLMPWPYVIVIGAVILFSYVIWFTAAIKRLHDLNMSGGCILISFLPIINSIFALFLLLMYGSKNTNPYGKPAVNTKVVSITAIFCLILQVFFISIFVSGYVDNSSFLAKPGLILLLCTALMNGCLMTVDGTLCVY